MNDAEAILAFWYAEGRDTYRPIWFQKNDAFDAEIRDRFGALIRPAREGTFDSWAETPTGVLASLKPPAPGAIPSSLEAVRIQRRVRLSLPMALEVAVRNDPDLAEQVAAVRERQGWLTSVRGRFWPELSLLAGSGYSQRRTDSTAWQGNEGIYPAGSPFLVKTDGWNQIQQNLQVTTAGLGLNWELVSFERNAALAETKDELKASQQRYANRLRQLQLDVSLAYYGLQLAEQLRRVRQAVVNNDTIVREEVVALKRSGFFSNLES